MAGHLRAAGHDVQPPPYVIAGVIGLVDGGILWWLDHRSEAGLDALTASLAAQVWLVLSDMLRRMGVEKL